MQWVIVGATGFVGSAVLRAAQDAGLDVTALPAPRLTSDAISAVQIIDEAARHPAVTDLAAALAGASVVVNAAGVAAPRGADTAELRGANALLPAVLAYACSEARVERLIHLSSAAVQGHREILDESSDLAPFSAYSRSKALGEEALRLTASQGRSEGMHPVVIRATSVQGAGRPTTAALARLAASPLASVAAPGTASTPVTSVESLADYVVQAGTFAGPLPAVILQPGEGMTVRSVLEAVGGTPIVLPRSLCRFVLRVGYRVSALLGERLHGSLRRVELMWFGQAQAPGWAEAHDIRVEHRVSGVLEAAGSRQRQSRPRKRRDRQARQVP
ncbi:MULTISPECIES: NAD-dependent epimerase/dehydratase family protein [unclassified Arthrobacter]|uniref:NAD-dependent epimerase/dehydratase family protein n=1 Tax=unclassified Arthrobacter TaxID=235627 RepID=UPI0014915343|nr:MULTISPECIES: NAD-dependent epimerase/dehydratase family protein [unclassified Arthrobacter]MBE0008588.1 NAD-dependent epimerase/dehydratase family protein [Arthrobacter sp. AET 35A]NOJ62422.1 NAD-dependent epimerase/dehydratase family protein [Arthrobacter sp. 147(2020)]